MEALNIEIINPKALKLIRGMQELELIKVQEEPISKLKAYLKNMRNKNAYAPSLEEISDIVDEVRTKRYAKL